MPLQKEETGNRDSFITSHVGLLPIKSRVSDINNGIDWEEESDLLNSRIL
jgi:hypothetical protein